MIDEIVKFIMLSLITILLVSVFIIGDKENKEHKDKPYMR